jgi:hypothetical protein
MNAGWQDLDDSETAFCEGQQFLSIGKLLFDAIERKKKKLTGFFLGTNGARCSLSELISF